MSTTFEAYPLNSAIPTFGAVLDLATVRIQECLQGQQIQETVALAFDVRDSEHRSHGVLRSAQFDFRGDGYSWFYWDGHGGGTDAYFEIIEDLDRECWHEALELQPRLQIHAADVHTALSIGHYWSFRRSAGQPARICMAYGFLAAAAAELTGGFLHSSDCAWDYERLPCRPSDFYAHWFRPGHGLSADTRAWHQRCIDSIGTGSN